MKQTIDAKVINGRLFVIFLDGSMSVRFTQLETQLIYRAYYNQVKK
jgi:hypothetical protein